MLFAWRDYIFNINSDAGELTNKPMANLACHENGNLLRQDDIVFACNIGTRLHF